MAETVDFIFIPLDNTIANAMQTVVGEANKTKTPIITSAETMVQQGGLATVGQNQFSLGVQSGKMAAAILKGNLIQQQPPSILLKMAIRLLMKSKLNFLASLFQKHSKKKPDSFLTKRPKQHQAQTNY